MLFIPELDELVKGKPRFIIDVEAFEDYPDDVTKSLLVQFKSGLIRNAHEDLVDDLLDSMWKSLNRNHSNEVLDGSLDINSIIEQIQHESERHTSTFKIFLQFSENDKKEVSEHYASIDYNDHLELIHTIMKRREQAIQFLKDGQFDLASRDMVIKLRLTGKELSTTLMHMIANDIVRIEIKGSKIDRTELKQLLRDHFQLLVNKGGQKKTTIPYRNQGWEDFKFPSKTSLNEVEALKDAVTDEFQKTQFYDDFAGVSSPNEIKTLVNALYNFKP